MTANGTHLTVLTPDISCSRYTRDASQPRIRCCHPVKLTAIPTRRSAIKKKKVAGLAPRSISAKNDDGHVTTRLHTDAFYACAAICFRPSSSVKSSRDPRGRTVVRLSLWLLPKMSGKSKAFTKEEELLLQDFSRNVSTKSSALFYGNAFIVSAIPIWLFWRIHLIDLYSNLISFVLVTLASTYALALAYKNTKFILKHKIAVKREDAVTKEISRKLAEDKKMSKKEKDERILWKKNEVADYEATTFSIFYNNALFLAFVIVSSFYVLKTFTPTVNYILSVGATSAFLALFSTGSQ